MSEKGSTKEAKQAPKGPKGLIIGGRYGEVLARQKSDAPFEIGELMIAEEKKQRVLVQVYDLLFGSQVSQQNRELLGGMRLEESSSFEFLDPHLREYTLALLKELVTLKYVEDAGRERKTALSLAKSLPGFFSELRDVTVEDFKFLNKPERPLFVGDLRSGSRRLDVPVSLDGREVLSHHVLIPATTGRGKSNLLKCLLWSAVAYDYAGMLVLDPHDEYYRPDISLRAHPARKKIHYYSTDPLPGAASLIINLRQLRPSHFNGAADWTSAQREGMDAYYKRYGDEWALAIARGDEIRNFNDATLGVLQRRFQSLLRLELDLSNDEEHGSAPRIVERGSFKRSTGESTIKDIVEKLERGETVIVDTSGFGGGQEILIGSILAAEVLARYKHYKTEGTLKEKPVISVVLEEAPRVLGKEVLEKGPNIFSTIAREGRKFGIGLIAITQLPSLIPRQVLANMNTKIILGIEMRPERQAVIESAAHDLSRDDRAIASLDKGEAIVTSNFVPFALPVKVPLFDDVVAASAKEEKKVEKNGRTGEGDGKGGKSFPGLKR